MPRGTPIRILRLAEALADRGHEVHVAAYHLGSGPVGDGVAVHRIRDIPSYRKLGPGPSYRKVLQVDPKLAVLVRRMLRDQSFDIVHAHHYEGLLVGAAARVGRRVPLVFDAHSLVASELPYFKLGLPMRAKAALGRFMDYSLPRLAEHTVCVTDAIRDALIEKAGLDPAQVSVVANGIEVEHFDPARVRPRPHNGKTVIFTGNLAEYQGIDLMLKAFRHVAARVGDARLVIATDSSFAPYEMLARELGVRERIDLMPAPAFKDLPGLLVNADVAVNPRTDCVGVPVKLLNYMAAARPVASYDGSAPGVEHGKTGWLAHSGDVEALADGIATLLEHPNRARAIGRAAREYVEHSCSWSRAAEHCEEIYSTLLGRRPRGRVVDVVWRTGSDMRPRHNGGTASGSFSAVLSSGEVDVEMGTTSPPAPVWRRVNPFLAVSIAPGPAACAEARALVGRRFLTALAPKLPRPGCTSPECQCRYLRYDDRRADRDRRAGPRESKVQRTAERRSGPGRRITDKGRPRISR